MKVKIILATALLFCSFHSNTALADDPCKVTLCLWGKMNGAEKNGCSSAEKSFFNIIKKKHGSFLPDHTFDARKKFLNNECPATYGVSQFVNKVLQKYGKVKL